MRGYVFLATYLVSLPSESLFETRMDRERETERLTRPENDHALRKWLRVVGPGEDETWTHEAIRECQRRKAGR